MPQKTAIPAESAGSVLEKRPAHHARLLSVLLVVVSTILASVLLVRQPTVAWSAQNPKDGVVSAESADIDAFTVQLAPGTDGIALVDRKNYTICLYQYMPRRVAHERFVLVAARSFRYDCRLQDYNNADPRPEKVKQWLDRAAGMEKTEEKPAETGQNRDFYAPSPADQNKKPPSTTPPEVPTDVK